MDRRHTIVYNVAVEGKRRTKEKRKMRRDWRPYFTGGKCDTKHMGREERLLHRRALRQGIGSARTHALVPAFYPKYRSQRKGKAAPPQTITTSRNDNRIADVCVICVRVCMGGGGEARTRTHLFFFCFSATSDCPSLSTFRPLHRARRASFSYLASLHPHSSACLFSLRCP